MKHKISYKLGLILSIVICIVLTGCNKQQDGEPEFRERSTLDDVKQALVDVDKQVIVDTDDIKISIESYDLKTKYDLDIILNVENKSDIRDMIYQTSNAYINGFDTSTNISNIINAGESRQDTITLSMPSMLRMSNEKFTEVALSIGVDTYIQGSEIKSINEISDSMTNYSCYIYPYGEDNKSQYSYTGDGTVLMDNSGCKVIATNYISDPTFGETINIYVESKYTDNVNISIENITINEQYAIDIPIQTLVKPGHTAAREVNIPSIYITELGLDKVEKIKFDIITYVADTNEELAHESGELTNNMWGMIDYGRQ